MRALIVGCVLWCALTATAVAQQSPAKALRQLQAPPATTVTPAPIDKSQPVRFSRIVIHPADGEPWALLYYGLAVYPEGTAAPKDQLMTWDAGRVDGNSDSFGRAFDSELSKNGFASASAEGSLFEAAVPADLQVGVLVTDVKGKFCGNCPSLFQRDKTTAVITMKARWEVYSTVKGGVVARVDTQGGVNWTQRIEGSVLPVMLEAFRENVRQLLASEDFRKVVLAQARTVSGLAPASTDPIRFTPASTPLPLSDAVNGVVTIFAGDGMGSGVLVSRDGYVLTNHHVASAGAVRIRWADGKETVGEVVRSDARRDVALVRIRPPTAAPLPIRHSEVKLGEAVYAVGTPREKEFSGTVTRGIVSNANRSLEGQTFIQSDVAITHGNSGGPLLDDKGWVIGLSDLAYEPGGVGQNINFFIPIDDALKVLAFQPAN